MTQALDPNTRRKWTRYIAALCALPAICIAFGAYAEDHTPLLVLGGVALILSVQMTVMCWRFIPSMRSRRERVFLLAIVVLFIGAVTSTALNASTLNLSLALTTLIATLAAATAGTGSYAIEKDGHDALSSLLSFVVLGSLSLLALPLLAWLNADEKTAHQWMLELYGIGNVRVLGHLSTIAIVVMMGALCIPGPRLVSDEGVMRVPRLVRRMLTHPASLAALLCLMWMVLFWSGSRAALLAIAVSLPIVHIALGRLDLRRTVLIGATLVVGAALSTLLWEPHPSYGMIDRLQGDVIEVSSGQSGIDDVSTGRVAIWTWAAGAIAERPWFGWGFMPMDTMEGSGVPKFDHAHNIALDYAMGFGVPAAAIVLGLALWLWIGAARAARANPTPAHAAALWLATMMPIYSMMSAMLIMPYQLIIWGAAMGALIGAGVRGRRDLQAPRTTPRPDASPVFLD